MKQLGLVVVLLLGGASAARADSDVYVSKPPLGNADLQAAGQYCDQRLGSVKNGTVTSPQYIKCMLSCGWCFQRTIRQRTWIDPDTGDTCHDVLGGAGSSCGNLF